MGPQVLPANLLQHGLLSLGPQLLMGTYSSMGSPWGHSFLQAHPPAPAWGPPQAAGGCLLHHRPPWAAGGQPASPWSSPQAAGESLPWCLEHLIPPPPSSLTLVSAGLFHTHIFFVTASAQHFLALKYVITEALPALLMGSALTSSRSVLELAGTGCAQHGGNSWCLLLETTPAALTHPPPPPANKTLLRKADTAAISYRAEREAEGKKP